MRAGNALFQRNWERTVVGLELPSFPCETRACVSSAVRSAWNYFLRTTTQPIEYPAPNEQMTPLVPLARSS